MDDTDDDDHSGGDVDCVAGLERHLKLNAGDFASELE